MKRLSAVSVCVALVFPLIALADQPVINVKKEPVKIMRRSFDPRRPPRDMPLMVPGEAGLCHYEFTSDIQTGGDTDTVSPNEVNITVDTVEIDLSLPITIWLETNAPKRIEEHENGHRQICEYYYANSEVYARRAAQSVMGKTYNGKGANKQAAVNDAMNKCISEINKQILDQTRVRAVACNDRYDKITDHSRNPGAQDEAAKKAESDDPEPPGGRPASATQPAAP